MSKQTVPVFNIERFAIHDGPGIRTTVFFQGCPLRCQWCANPESQQVGPSLMFLEKKCTGCARCVQKCPQGAVSIKDGKASVDRSRCIGCGICEETCLNGAMSIIGKVMTPDDIYQIVLRDEDYYKQTGGGLTLSGGEALLYIRRIIPLLEQCRERGIHIAVETCGNVPMENIEMAVDLVDLFLFDIKTLDAEKLLTYTGGDLQQIKQNFARIAENHAHKIVIRVPVIPEVNHTAEEIRQIFELAIKSQVTRVDLLPYHTLGLTKYRQLGIPYPFKQAQSLRKEELLPYKKMGENLGLDVIIGG